MRALVISGGGSKGAFAGGVAEFLIDTLQYKYDLFVGTSTGSLLISHLALGEVQKIKEVYTHVSQDDIFNHMPFTIKNTVQEDKIGINHLSMIKGFIQGKRTFGESENLKKLIFNTLTEEDFYKLKHSDKDVVVTVSNLSLDTVEYKSIKDFGYKDFCEWIWLSANFAPFMSVGTKNKHDYVDGGFGDTVPIVEAIQRGAKIVDVIILRTEFENVNKLPAKNAFSLMTDLFSYMANRIENQSVKIGKFVAAKNNVILNLYYTPTVLTTNPLIFNQEKMKKWWEIGYQYAQKKSNFYNEL
ncbi:MAG: patatin-like phospholipase family protein [Chitinophagales bacterium]|nr:patatin-like phospholipase family protein [Chitinophagales bacterium]